MGTVEEKWCASCGRRIEWRKKWERSWEQVRYCSGACRRRGVRPVDRELEEALLDLLDARSASASVCPSEAARRVAGRQGEGGAPTKSAKGGRSGGDDASEDWRVLMEPARRAARRLVVRGQVEITQRGQVVDPSTASGPIRVRRARGQ